MQHYVITYHHQDIKCSHSQGWAQAEEEELELNLHHQDRCPREPLSTQRVTGSPPAASPTVMMSLSRHWSWSQHSHSEITRWRLFLSAESDDLDKSTIHENIVTLFKDRFNKSLSIQLQPVKVLTTERLVSPTLFSSSLIVRKVRWMGRGEVQWILHRQWHGNNAECCTVGPSHHQPASHFTAQITSWVLTGCITSHTSHEDVWFMGQSKGNFTIH